MKEIYLIFIVCSFAAAFRRPALTNIEYQKLEEELRDVLENESPVEKEAKGLRAAQLGNTEKDTVERQYPMKDTANNLLQSMKKSFKKSLNFKHQRSQLEANSHGNENLNNIEKTANEVSKREVLPIVEVSGANCGWFLAFPQNALYGFNTKTLYGQNLQSCAEACATEYHFYCRSFDYVEDSETCYLSSESDETMNMDFGPNFNTVYYRRLCSEPTLPPTTSTTTTASYNSGGGSGYYYYNYYG